MNTDSQKVRTIVERAIADQNGILRMEPAWVARDFVPAGKRLKVAGGQFDLGERGSICERWLASTTKADNKIGPPDEGLSYVALKLNERMTLRQAIEVAGSAIMGARYASTHPGLCRLAKLFDYAYRLPYHLHQMKQHAALVGQNPKEESYYFPEGVEMGFEPDSYFGVHPSIAEEKRHDVLLPYWVDWNSDLILRHARGYHLYPDDGFHIPAGILHAPGSALTIELQEDSDVLAMLQARAGGKTISKELLWKDVRAEDRLKHGERIILDMIDWEANGDHYFFENRHTPPIPIKENRQAGGNEYWIFYNTLKFSGKKLVVHRSGRFTSADMGVYSVLVWEGSGRVDGKEVEGGNPNLDELLVCHERATEPMVIENTGERDLVLFKFFGPDINPDVPKLKQYRST